MYLPTEPDLGYLGPVAVGGLIGQPRAPPGSFMYVSQRAGLLNKLQEPAPFPISSQLSAHRKPFQADRFGATLGTLGPGSLPLTGNERDAEPIAPFAARLPDMAQFGASSLRISASPISPVAASSTSPGSGPTAAPPPPSGRVAGTGPGASTATPSQAVHQPQPPQHKRVYQACIPCRMRKVRCDMGPVDAPHDPPCVRCRRESKECYFSATRRKRKVDDGSLDGDLGHDDYIRRNGRKHMRGESPLDRRLYSDVPLTPGGSQGRSQPLRRPADGPKSARSNSTGEFGNGEPNTPLENLEARAVMRREVYGPQDALDLLYKAATEELVDCPCDCAACC